MTQRSPEPLHFPAPIPANEAQRLAALHRYKILDTPPESAFDRITTLAARLFNMPIVLVSLVDESRAWFKSCYGFDLPSVPREATLCSFALLYDEVLVVPDTRLDERFACNPFVQREPGVRFYAGAPLLTQDGFNLGTLCLLDTQPREALSLEQQTILADLAAIVVDELELRLAARRMAQQEAALQENEARLRTLIKNMPGMVYRFAPCADGPDAFTYVSTGSRDLFELEPETVLQDARSLWALIHPDDFPSLSASVAAAVECSGVWQWEGRLITPSGQLKWIQGISRPQQTELGEVWDGLIVDITDRKQAEIALSQSEERFRQMAETIQDVFWISIPLEQRLLYVSPAYEQVWGRSCESVYANHEEWLDAIHPDDREQVRTTLYQQVMSGNYDVEYRIVRPDGSIRWVRDRGFPISEETGKPYRVAGVAEDITGRKQAEADLRESEARYRLLAEAIPQFVWITNAEGQNEYVNQQFCDYTGLSAEQMQGLDWLSIIHPDDLERTRDCWTASVNNGEFYEIEYRFRRADGTYRWFLGQGIPLKDEQGRAVKWFGTCTDIEPQKQIEQARLLLLEQEQAARATAEQANRIKDEFLAVLSHELRTPMNPILGWSKLLRNGKLDSTRTAHALETIERNAQLQVQLIDDLLDISRILRGKLSLAIAPVDLGTVIAAALETVRLAVEAKSLSIQTQLSPTVGLVNGDAGRLQQVMWNLLSNAVKFTPANGQITVALTQVGTNAQIQVADTGKGIQPDFLPYVFEHFRQEDAATTRKFGGLGLGLAIGRQIVEMHGGTVRAESPGEGQGATFTVRLPLLGSRELGFAGREDNPDSPLSTSYAQLTGLRILVVDDQADSRELVAFVLEQADAIVTSVSSGIEALQTIAQSKFDLVISDIGMPEMDGYLLMQQLRTLPTDQNSQIPAIALTAYAGEYDQRQAIAVGFQQHISKPVAPEALVRTIVALVQRNGDD